MLKKNKEMIATLINELLESPNIRPYLFRTRFERNMIRVIKYAEEVGNKALLDAATNCANKLKSITDKSNTTSCGIPRSYVILEDDINKLLSYV